MEVFVGGCGFDGGCVYLEARWLAERLTVEGKLSWDRPSQRLGVKRSYALAFLPEWGQRHPGGGGDKKGSWRKLRGIKMKRG